MLNKKGFSMIEVIICLAMLAILSVSAFSLSGHIKYANTKKCAKLLNQTLEQSRMTSMSKAGKWKLYLYRYDGELYYNLTNEASLDKSKGRKVGGSKINLYYMEKGSSSETKLSNTKVLQIGFERSTGAYSNADGSTIFTTLRVAGEEGKGYTIELVEKTGKHIFNKAK